MGTSPPATWRWCAWTRAITRRSTPSTKTHTYAKPWAWIRALSAATLRARPDAHAASFAAVASEASDAFLRRSQEALIDYLIKWNPHRESPNKWLAYVAANGEWSVPRPGTPMALLAVRETPTQQGFHDNLRRVLRIIEPTEDKRDQHLSVSQIKGGWTSLMQAEEPIVALYPDRTTFEQFHSDFKTPLVVARLPSGKFPTNALVPPSPSWSIPLHPAVEAVCSAPTPRCGFRPSVVACAP